MLLQLNWVTSFAYLPTTAARYHTADGMASKSESLLHALDCQSKVHAAQVALGAKYMQLKWHSELQMNLVMLSSALFHFLCAHCTGEASNLIDVIA